MWYELFFCTCIPHNLNIFYVVTFQRCKNVVRHCPLNFWEVDPQGSIIFKDLTSFVYMVIDISGFIGQPQNWLYFNICYSCIYRWHFWQNWWFFKVNEALGRLLYGLIIYHFIMEYIPLSLIVLNWERLQEKWQQSLLCTSACLPRVPLEGLRWRPRRRQKLRRGQWWS